ncbi:hypothetical protein CDAR_509381 [Caerostris darwini]|uniref:Uncharacterized protein n=1 Tax=Caerostris darwini TaxID=1538125 RepID=A0AAV4UUN3_9ARAC|nr:hypothetical protein CDAR_509381 [Caerostris darwini]
MLGPFTSWKVKAGKDGAAPFTNSLTKTPATFAIANGKRVSSLTPPPIRIHTRVSTIFDLLFTTATLSHSLSLSLFDDQHTAPCKIKLNLKFYSFFSL